MQLDLNLLVALDALLEEGSVAGAADRLHLSAPAMSRALGRVRAATGDDIMVRTGRTMTLTPRAQTMREQVHDLVRQASDLLRRDTAIDLAHLGRTFTLRWHDAITTTAGPSLIAHVRQQAPGVRLRFLPETTTDTDDLRHGRVDLEVNAGQPAGTTTGSAPALSADVHVETVATDHLVAVTGTDPAAPDGARGLDGSDAELTLEGYLAAAHVTVSRRGRLRDVVDDVLEARGLTRRVVASVPTVSAALHVVATSDVLATIPATTIDAFTPGQRLRRLPLPLDTPRVPVVLAWHARYTSDPAHTWLRDLVRQALLHTTAGRLG